LLLIYRSVRFRGEGDQAHAAGACNDEVQAQQQQRVRQPEDEPAASGRSLKFMFFLKKKLSKHFMIAAPSPSLHMFISQQKHCHQPVSSRVPGKIQSFFFLVIRTRQAEIILSE